jgi:LuxR family transcriptional regulator, maltose regulon positive regulatory protein
MGLNAAAPQGYIRVFLDVGEPILELLSRVREEAPAFVDAILNAGRSARTSTKQPLIDPLTDRELEVLRLVAAGLSNPEIAERLIITLSTVKRHINHLYSKLEVITRTQAVAKGRELRLIEP